MMDLLLTRQAGLVSNQIDVHNLRAEAILHKRKGLVVQALLADPVVDVSNSIPALVDHMINEQGPWLSYLKEFTLNRYRRPTLPSVT
jgi:alpha-galactosidase